MNTNKKSEDASKPRRRRGNQASEKDGTKNLKPTSVPQRDNGGSSKPSSAQKSLLIVMGADCNGWYDVARHIPGRNDTVGGGNGEKLSSNQLVKYWRQRADELYEIELALFLEQAKSSQTADDRWVESTTKHGTMKDRVAAMAVLVAEHPFHRLSTLDNLLNLAGSGQQRVSHMAGEALTDLIINTLLPPGRKLIPLASRPLSFYEQQNGEKGNDKTKNKKNASSDSQTHSYKTLSPRVLLLWRYEELVKQRYSTFLSIISGWLNDQLELHKIFALRTSITLLVERSEGEGQLLEMVVNKVGDPSKKVAAAAGHQLRRLLERHPAMTKIVAREVQQLAFRPHLSSRALYNCIVFLNQLRLVKDNGKDSLPASLVKTYFRLFEVAVTKGGEHKAKSENGEMKSRLLCALLTGVNRAHPYLPTSDQEMEGYVDALYRIVHQAPVSASTQALMLLFNLAIGTASEQESQNEAVTTNDKSRRQDRFYRVLYAKLSDTSMLVGRQVTMFFNLIYKAMKHDENEVRILAFAKRLLQMTCHSNAAVAAGSLFLISEVMKVRPSLRASVDENIPTEFDTTVREPSGALGESKKGSLWELSTLLFHFHPSVVKFSESIGDVSYNSDPLRDFTLAPFLDRLAYRQPKARPEGAKREERFVQKINGSVGSVPMNDPSFLGTRSVAEDEKFFRRYFEERARRDETKGIVRRKKEEDEEDDFDQDEAVYAKEQDLDANFDWESDPEEEEFVNQLAEKLIDQHAGGKQNYDDEDPDMEGWGNFDSSDEDDDDDSDDNEDDELGNDAMPARAKSAGRGEGDMFMDDSGSSAGEEESSMEGDPFDNEDSSNGSVGDDHIDSDEAVSDEENSDEDGRLDNTVEYAAEDESHDMGAPDERPQTSSNKKEKKNRSSESLFEDAENYEALIAKAWADRDRQKRKISDEPADRNSKLVGSSKQKKKK